MSARFENFANAVVVGVVVIVLVFVVQNKNRYRALAVQTGYIL